MAGSGLHLAQLRPKKESVPDQQQEEWAQEHQWQTEYPGWRWDAERQEWVADPSTAPQPYADPADAETRQMPTRERPEDDERL